MELILCVDFGSTYTKLTAIDENKEEVVATAKSITTVETGIMDGYNDALDQLNSKLGDYTVKTRLGCSSAAGGLKMVVIGNVADLTTDAAKKAALGAGARILKSYNFDLSEDEVKEIREINADLILLAGGTDGGNQKYITNNANIISDNKLNIPVIVAGNKSAQKTIKEIFEKGKVEYYITENIMPELNKLNIEPVRKTIRKVFMETIINAKGLGKAIALVDNEIIPTPLSIIYAANAIAEGSDVEYGIGSVVVVDIGGATTDIHSICKGLPSKADVTLKGMEEPFDKRTVEGDLGMRYSAQSLLESVKTRAIQKGLKEIGLEMDADQIKAEITKRSSNVNMIPTTPEEFKFDQAMAMACTTEGTVRHAGIIETGYGAFGAVRYQVGKDLLRTEYLIGTGGVIVHSNSPEEILKCGLYSDDHAVSLRPLKPRMLLDKDYIMSALGLLSTYNRELSTKMLKKYLTKIGE